MDVPARFTDLDEKLVRSLRRRTKKKNRQTLILNKDKTILAYEHFPLVLKRVCDEKKQKKIIINN